uniref:Uncharacterized protein n=1 Tax=Anguilla anguilla TaxID=7936 RepID=A0A0E9V5G2_ANGAN
MFLCQCKDNSLHHNNLALQEVDNQHRPKRKGL